jgi:hypothetical protein
VSCRREDGTIGARDLAPSPPQLPRVTRSSNGGGPTRQTRRRREQPPLPRHPYRDSALLHAVFALVIVVVALLTDGSIVTALLVACGYFGVATAWSWVRFSQRLRAAAPTESGKAAEGDG